MPEAQGAQAVIIVQDPLAACTRMLGQREPCQPKDSDAKTADVATIEVGHAQAKPSTWYPVWLSNGL